MTRTAPLLTRQDDCTDLLPQRAVDPDDQPVPRVTSVQHTDGFIDESTAQSLQIEPSTRTVILTQPQQAIFLNGGPSQCGQFC